MRGSAWGRAVAVLSCVSYCGGVAACGGGAAPSAPLIQVGGSYDIRKAFVEDTCGSALAGQVFTNSGSVQHSPGASAFVLNDHGTRDLPGAVSRDGSFALEAASAVVHGTMPAVDTFSEGRFTTTGFHLHDVTDVSATSTNAACRIVAAWDATKIGSPNIIPDGPF